MLGAKNVVQGARVYQYVSRQRKEEPIRGLISQEFIFLKRGMLGTLIIGSNTCQVLMYVNAFNQGVPGHARDYM